MFLHVTADHELRRQETYDNSGYILNGCQETYRTVRVSQAARTSFITGHVTTTRNPTRLAAQRLIKGVSCRPGRRAYAEKQAGFDRSFSPWRPRRRLDGASRSGWWRRRRRRLWRYPCNYCGQMDDNDDDNAADRPTVHGPGRESN